VREFPLNVVKCRRPAGSGKAIGQLVVRRAMLLRGSAKKARFMQHRE